MNMEKVQAAVADMFKPTTKFFNQNPKKGESVSVVVAVVLTIPRFSPLPLTPPPRSDQVKPLNSRRN